MRRLLVIFMVVLLSLALVLGACAQKAPELKREGWPAHIRIGSGQAGHPTYIPTVGMSEMIAKYLQVESAPAVYSTVSALAGALNKGEIEMGTSASINVYQAFYGSGGKEPLKEGWILTTGETIALLTMARKDSGINTMTDVRGKRWSMLAGSKTHEAVRAAMEKAWGLTEADYQLVPVSGPDGVVAAFREGKTDVANYFVTVSTPWVKELCLADIIYFVPRTDEEIAKVLEADPMFVPVTLPADVYACEKDAVKSFGMLRVIIAHKDLPEDLVYAITAAIYDHFEEFAGYGAALKYFQLPDAIAVEKLQAPVHPGAIMYYKEKGYWTKQHEEKQAALLKEFGF